MKYQSPSLWTPDEINKLFAQDHIKDPSEMEAWATVEAKRRNDLILESSLGPNTGWSSKWLAEIEREPTGQPWRTAFAKAHQIVHNRGMVFLVGSNGPGKTRMAAELALSVGASRYRTAMRFFLEIRNSYRPNAEKGELEIIDDLAATPLLILDEMQERGETGFEDRLLTHLVDARYANQRPTVMIANLSPDQLATTLGGSIVDRWRENGAIIECNWASFRGLEFTNQDSANHE